MKKTFTPYRLGLGLGLMQKDATKHLRQFATRQERLEFCRGYSAGIEAAQRAKKIEGTRNNGK